MKRPTRRGRSCRDKGFFATDVEGIERVGAVGAVFEQVFFGLRKFASCGVNFSEFSDLQFSPDLSSRNTVAELTVNVARA